MRHYHRLGGVCNKVTGDERILHSDVTHGNTVANRDSGEYDRRTACHSDAELDRLGDFVKIHMTRNYLVIAVHYADKRLMQLLAGNSESVVEASRGAEFKALGYSVFDHRDTPLYSDRAG